MRQLSLWMAQNSCCSRLHCLLNLNQQGKTSNINPPSPTVSLETKKEEKKVGEGSVSLTFIMIKEKPVYPYNTLSLKHRVPPHRRPFFLQPISHREPHLHRAQPQSGGARGERRCQEQLTPPKSIQHFTLCFHFLSSQGDFIKVSSDKLSPSKASSASAWETRSVIAPQFGWGRSATKQSLCESGWWITRQMLRNVPVSNYLLLFQKWIQNIMNIKSWIHLKFTAFNLHQYVSVFFISYLETLFDGIFKTQHTTHKLLTTLEFLPLIKIHSESHTVISKYAHWQSCHFPVWVMTGPAGYSALILLKVPDTVRAYFVQFATVSPGRLRNKSTVHLCMTRVIREWKWAGGSGLDKWVWEETQGAKKRLNNTSFERATWEITLNVATSARLGCRMRIIRSNWPADGAEFDLNEECFKTRFDTGNCMLYMCNHDVKILK